MRRVLRAMRSVLRLLSKVVGGSLRLLLLSVIRIYQLAVSPLFPPTCRFHPTCSAYAIEAIERYGVWHGGRLAAGRILRCHPWGGHGYDPVP